MELVTSHLGPSTMPTCRDVGHAYSIFLRMYTEAAGALMGRFAIVSSIEIAASVRRLRNGELFFTCPQVMQLALGVIALAIFEVLFGGLIVAAEFHVKIVARYGRYAARRTRTR